MEIGGTQYDRKRALSWFRLRLSISLELCDGAKREAVRVKICCPAVQANFWPRIPDVGVSGATQGKTRRLVLTAHGPLNHHRERTTIRANSRLSSLLC